MAGLFARTGWAVASVTVVAFWSGAAIAQVPSVDTEIVERCVAAADPRDCIGSGAAACIDAASGATAVQSHCYGEELDIWDGLLNAFYRAATDRAGALDASGQGPAVGVDALRDMQRAWIGYRDARCTLVALTYGGGTGAGPGGIACRMRVTAEQALVLRDLRDRLD